MKISAEETHKLVAKFSKELPTTSSSLSTTVSSNTNPKKTPRFLDRISEETARALRFMSKLRYVTDQEPIDKSLRRHGTSRPRPLHRKACHQWCELELRRRT